MNKGNKFRPQDDLYMYVNNKWDNKTSIPSSYSKWSVFEKLHEKKLKVINEIINTSDNNTIQILKYQYTKKKNKELFVFDKHNIKTKNDLVSLIGYLNQYSFGNFLNVYIIPDFKNSQYNILGIYPSLLLLPEKSYYINKNKYPNVHVHLKKFVEEMFELLGIEQNYEEILEIQTRIAKSMMDKEDSRIPEKTYNIFTLKKLKLEMPNFDWELFFHSCNISTIKEIIIGDIKECKEFVSIMNSYSLKTLKNFLILKYIISISDIVNDKIEKRVFQFYGNFLAGKQKMKSKTKRCVEFLSNQIGETISQEYLKKINFTKKSKTFMTTIVKFILKSYKNRILNISWMQKQTKKKALIKLSKMKYKIGYPDYFKDYSKISIHQNNSLLKNVMLINKFEYTYDMSFLYKKPDNKTWSMMAYEINAYYSPLNNEFVFPAGILQKPFFDLHLSLPEIYGGIGAIIGHEITHGFDDQGKKFDEKGNLKNWWTKNDEIKYNKNAKKIIQQYDRFKVNGKLTQGENIADLGGLLISLDALKIHKRNVTDNDIKLYFQSWARNWRWKVTDKELQKKILTDVHSPNNFRVNGPVIHIDDFHRVYATKSGDKMYLSKEKRINIW